MGLRMRPTISRGFSGGESFANSGWPDCVATAIAGAHVAKEALVRVTCIRK
jgi:hypothetical protein